MTIRPAFKLTLTDKPNWLSHLEITRDGNEIEIDVVKENGLSYGHVRLSLVDFNNMADILLTP
jgi:hypothetical protein